MAITQTNVGNLWPLSDQWKCGDFVYDWVLHAPHYLGLAGNARAKAQEIRRDGKEVEIIEAHLFDMATSFRSILCTLDDIQIQALARFRSKEPNMEPEAARLVWVQRQPEVVGRQPQTRRDALLLGHLLPMLCISNQLGSVVIQHRCHRSLGG